MQATLTVELVRLECPPMPARSLSEDPALSRDVPVDVLTLSLARLPRTSRCARSDPDLSLRSRPHWRIPRGAALQLSGLRIVALKNMDVRAAALLCLAASMAVKAGVRAARGCKRSAGAGRAQRGLDLSLRHIGTGRDRS